MPFAISHYLQAASSYPNTLLHFFKCFQLLRSNTAESYIIALDGRLHAQNVCKPDCPARDPSGKNTSYKKAMDSGKQLASVKTASLFDLPGNTVNENGPIKYAGNGDLTISLISESVHIHISMHCTHTLS
jgi:hypothetical protein